MAPRRLVAVETFVVRLVSDGTPPISPDDEIRGVVRRVSDGEEVAFTSGGELIELLRVADWDQR